MIDWENFFKPENFLEPLSEEFELEACLVTQLAKKCAEHANTRIRIILQTEQKVYGNKKMGQWQKSCSEEKE